jgi:hypothetical protein
MNAFKFKTMKNLITILAAVFLMVSCKKEETKDVNDVINEVKETTEVVAKEGSGKVILTCNNKEFVAEGVCGALVSMGELAIAVKDKTNPAKVFTMTFNGEGFPEDGKVYKIESKDYSKEGNGSADEVSVSFTEVLSKKMNSWGSDNAKGTIQFAYNGNEVKCILKNIVLTSAEMYNADDLTSDGTVSGELTFFKN